MDTYGRSQTSCKVTRWVPAFAGMTIWTRRNPVERIHSPGMTAHALEGIRVIDISTTVAAAWCSRLLAGFGAQVTAVEPPAGHPLRSHADPTTDALAEYVLSGKQCLALDTAAGPGREKLLAHLATADILVSDLSPARLDALGLSYARLRQPSLVMVHVTPFGVSGVLAEAPGNDLAVAARSGWAMINGRHGREPLKPSGTQSSYFAGAAAFAGSVAALIHRDNHPGEGQEVDVGALDAMVTAFAAALLRAQYAGEVSQRSSETDITTGPVPVADGHFALTISRAHFWRDAMNLLGLPDLADDLRWEASWYRQAHKDEYVERVQEKMRGWTKEALFEGLAALREVAGPVLEFPELLGNQHLRERGFWGVPAEGPSPRQISHAGAPFKMSATPWVAAGVVAHEAAKPSQGHPVASHDLGLNSPEPLAGLRGIVLTQAWAGSFCTELLGMLGADIIQVEVRKRPDAWRGGYDAPIGGALKDMPTAQHPWNTNALYNSVNLGKRCITLDLQTVDGIAVFRKLLPFADFVAENFSPRVLGNLGISYEEMRTIRPDVILCSLSAYGHSGPWSNVPGIGGTIEPTSGMSALLGYEDGPPMNSGQMYPDAVAGMYGCSAILTAIHHRNRTGEGQYIDLSMQEANLTFVGDAALEYLQTGKQRGRLGNRHPVFAPHGIYPCAGDDRWVAIACETDAQWAALAAIIGCHPLTNLDVRLRKRNEAEIDGAVSVWTSVRERDAIVAQLAAAAVIAAPVLDAHEVANDPGLRARGTILDVTHPETGTWPQAGLPIRFSRTPGSVKSSAPLLGEHSYEVLAELLGMSQVEYDRLVAAGISGMGPPDAG